jgi:hypothetical protein
MTVSVAALDACRTDAIGSPVAGFTDTSGAASGSTIHRSGPEHAPALTDSM